MLSNDQKQTDARLLFMQSGLTQQQIAGHLNISRKTIGLWIQQGHWRDMKKTAAQAPGFILQDFYDQLTSLNNAICTRTEAPYPTAAESAVQRRLMMSIKSFEQQPVSNYIQIFTELLNELMVQDMEMTKKIAPITDAIVQRMVQKQNTHNVPQRMFLNDEDPIDEEETPEENTSEENPPLPNAPEETPCNTNVTSCNVTENNINQPPQTQGHLTLPKTSQNKRSPLAPQTDIKPGTKPSPVQENTKQQLDTKKETEKTPPAYALPNGITWVGKNKVFDPSTGRTREITFLERSELRKLFANGTRLFL